MALTEQQFAIYQGKLRAALADANTPAEVKERIEDIARRFPVLAVKTDEDLFDDVREFALRDPAQWTVQELNVYTKWVLENQPVADPQQ
jgi:hypothetical protein